MNNKLTISAAGSGKTTYLVDEALKISDGNVLITTYTDANEEEIKRKIIEKRKCIPSNIRVQTWFSFLIQHGVKPYQGTFNENLFGFNITGLLLNNGEYGRKRNGKNIRVPYKEKTDFMRHYFSDSGKIYSDKLSQFVCKANKASKGNVISRISRLFNYFFIDEVQDLAGYDFDIIKLLLKSNTKVLMAGDPRQVVYLTHHARKYRKMNLQDFLAKKCGRRINIEIDWTTLNCSHRNNKYICEFSSKLYPNPWKTDPCICCRGNDIQHQGIFLVKKSDKEKYLREYNPIQLKWSVKTTVDDNYDSYSFGNSKGRAFDRVLIYPTDDIEKWVFNQEVVLKPVTKAKLYVGITRARYSVAIVVKDFPSNTPDNVQLYNS